MRIAPTLEEMSCLSHFPAGEQGRSPQRWDPPVSVVSRLETPVLRLLRTPLRCPDWNQLMPHWGLGPGLPAAPPSAQRRSDAWELGAAFRLPSGPGKFPKVPEGFPALAQQVPGHRPCGRVGGTWLRGHRVACAGRRSGGPWG